MKPTYDELLALIQELKREIAELRKENTELKERLNLNSKNSSKPPSSDQKKNKNAPKGGGVKGHPGYHRKLFPKEEVNQVISSKLISCGYCGSKKLRFFSPQIFQQIEVPPIQPIVTQIECEKGQCLQCGKNLVAPMPRGYEKSSFGPRLSTWIGMCSSVYRMSKRSVQSLLTTILGVDLSLGVIPTIEQRVSKALEPCDEELMKVLKQSRIAYVDETSFRQECKSHYVWTITSKSLAAVRVLPTRGLDSLAQIRPRGDPGITVTDRYGVYAYKKHQYCLAHIQRDFKRFAERESPDKELGKRAMFELQEIFLAQRLHGQGEHCDAEMRQRVNYRKNRLKNILEEIMAEGTDKFALFAERILDHYHKLFLFTRYPEVDCTNNLAERTLRHIVLWRKTSYGTQSEKGSRFLERTISVWMSLKKQGKEVMPFFLQA